MEKFSPGLKRSISFSTRFICAVTGIFSVLQTGRSCADLAKIKDFCSTRLTIFPRMGPNSEDFLFFGQKVLFGTQFYFVLFPVRTASQSDPRGHFARSAP